jgi:hypothetical protein
MKSVKAAMARCLGTAAVAAISVVGGAGCGAVDAEGIDKVTHAIGSTEGLQYIDNWTQLTQMTETGNYLLRVNLNASGKTWTPKLFRGTFDGGGLTISNLSIDTSADPARPHAGFFSELEGAIVRNVKFSTLTVKARSHAGGVAGTAGDSLIELVSVHNGSISTPTASGISAGGIVGTGANVQIRLSSVKGTISSAVSGLRYAGGIAGYLIDGDAKSEVERSYAWVTVAPHTDDVNRIVFAGGIVGWLFGSEVREVYAVGAVTGRGGAGGLVGKLTCDEGNPFVLNKGIYRGDVIDRNRPQPAGWAGTFGTFQDCTVRFDQLFWDQSADPSTVWGTNDPQPQRMSTRQELMSPVTPNSGVYASPDNTFDTSVWDAGTNSQHHALKGMPGGLTTQPRCVVNGVPTAC